MAPPRDHVDRVVEQWGAARPELDAGPIRIVGRVSRLSRGIDRQLQTVFDRHQIEAWASRGQTPLFSAAPRPTSRAAQ
jgi:hypothetical protein